MTPIDIVNIGIEALGERPISSFEEQSTAAVCARATFRATMEAVLELDVWNDATATATLAAEVSAPRDYARQFILPGDCLRVRGLIKRSDPWTRRGRRLMTNAPAPLDVLYTRNLAVSPSGQPIGDGEDIQMSGLLAAVVGLRWAWTNARRITGSDTAMQAMHQLYRQALVDAAAVDGAEGTPQAQQVGSWVNQFAPESWV